MPKKQQPAKSSQPPKPQVAPTPTNSTPQTGTAANRSSAEIKELLENIINDQTTGPEHRQKMQENLLGQLFVRYVKDAAVKKVAGLPLEEQVAGLQRVAENLVDSLFIAPEKPTSATDEYEEVEVDEEDTLEVISEEYVMSAKNSPNITRKRPQEELEEGGAAVKFPAQPETDTFEMLQMFEAVTHRTQQEQQQEAANAEQNQGWFPRLSLWGQ